MARETKTITKITCDLCNIDDPWFCLTIAPYSKMAIPGSREDLEIDICSTCRNLPLKQFVIDSYKRYIFMKSQPFRGA